MIAFVWAEDLDGVIGNKGRLPWHIKADLARFKALTLNQNIVMGHKTYQSFPNGPLPKRNHIVLTHQPANSFPTTVECYNSEQELKDRIMTDKRHDYFIIGGVSLFKLFENEVTDLFQTKIQAHYLGDTYMPKLDLDHFQLVEQQFIAGNPDLYFNDFVRIDKFVGKD